VVKIKGIEIVKLERDIKKHLITIAGIAIMVLGFILLLEYIWHFFKIFLGMLLILIGLYLIIADKPGFKSRRFKF
jgi:uncharacterized membrane protein YfcA